MPTHALSIFPVTTPDHLVTIRELFLEYSNSIEIDLCFQNFQEELNTLPGRYAHPEGKLFLASLGADIVGCVGVRKLEAGLAEMKRLYIRPAARGQGIGRSLGAAAVDFARRNSYARMRLDTLPTMSPAISLYRSLGFHEIAPPLNAEPGILYFELKLV
jgi:ribosomal protein S18 acetylase RimI-like enzyme